MQLFGLPEVTTRYKSEYLGAQPYVFIVFIVSYFNLILFLFCHWRICDNVKNVIAIQLKEYVSLHAVFLLMKAGIFAAFLVALGCGMLSQGHRQDLSRSISCESFAAFYKTSSSSFLVWLVHYASLALVFDGNKTLSSRLRQLQGAFFFCGMLMSHTS